MSAIIPVLVALFIITPCVAVLIVELRRYELKQRERAHRQRIDAFIKQRQKDKLL